MTDHHHEHDHHQMPTLERHCDVAVIGGSAAGLAAALQIARQRRSVLVIDDGSPRNAPAEHMHGYLGREGAAPSELVAIGRDEVRQYGGEILTGRALDVTHTEDGRFRVALTGGHSLVARRVLVATGVTDVLPDIPGFADGWGRWIVHCPFCHGYEVRDQRLIQVVTHPMGLHPTTIFRNLTSDLAVVLHDGVEVDEATVAKLEAGGITFLRDTVTQVSHDGAEVTVELRDGEPLRGDAIVAGSSFRARIDMLSGLGITAAPHASGMGDVLEVDPMMGSTSVPGVFAAGNVTDPSLQVLPSAAQGSRTGAFLTFGLADEDLTAATRPEMTRGDWENRYSGDKVWSANPNGTLVAEATGLAPGRALDVGAGEGADAIWLAEQGWTVTATEISEKALERIGAEADRRGVEVDLLRSDATDRDAFGTDTYDLVSLQYGSFVRSPDQRGLRNLLDAVAPGGTLLAVHHDLSPLDQPVDVSQQTHMYDPRAYVGIDEVRAAVSDSDAWTVEVDETRDRPPGAASTHHVSDVVLRATRRA